MFGRVVAALAAVAAGCGGGGDAAIAIDGAPRIALTEGELASLAISVESPPDSGDCASPLAATGFTAEIDGRDPAELFDVFELHTESGALVLDLEPRCDLMGPGDADILFELSVSSPSGCASTGAARLQISSAPVTGCGPRVLAWTGDCSVVAEDAGLSLAIAATPTPDPLCVSVRSRDAARETLAVRSQTNFPDHILDGGDLPTADGVDGAVLFSIPLADTSNLAGVYTLDTVMFLEEVAAGSVPDFSETIALTVGDADLAIDVSPIDEPVSELAVEKVAVRLWGAGRDGPVSLCARASRVDPGGTPLPRNKPFLRLDNPLTGDASSSEFVCGSDFRLSISPAVDSVALEQISIEAAHCDSCDNLPAPLTEPIARVIELATESVVEQAQCTGNVSPAVGLGCADISGDGTPELVFAGRTGANPITCAFAGDQGRLTAIPLAAGSPDAERVTAFTWRDPDNGPTPIILGSFATGALIRRLAIDPATEASWAAATELGIDAVQSRLDLTVALADDPSGGATHLARFDAVRQGIEITCIAPNDPVITGCADVSLPGLLAATANFRGLAGVDLDGDGDLDLVAYEGDGAGESPIRLHAFRLSWPDANAPQVDETVNQNTALDASVVAVAVADSPGCSTPPCRQLALAVHQGTGHGNGIAHFTQLPSGTLSNLDTGIEPTLGPTRGASRAGGVPLVASAYGVSIPIGVGSQNTSFELADPVLIEDQLVGPQAQQASVYGVDVTSCAGAATPSFAAVVNSSEARVVRRDVSVESF